MVGRISKQQVKVFAIFAVAFVSAALTSAYANIHQTDMALLTGLLSLVMIATVWMEGYSSDGR